MALSWDDKREKIHDALRARYPNAFTWIQDLFDDSLVVSHRPRKEDSDEFAFDDGDRTFLKMSWALLEEDGKPVAVVLGDPSEVEERKEWVKVAQEAEHQAMLAAHATISEGAGSDDAIVSFVPTLMEAENAVDESGFATWHTLIAAPGVSHNRFVHTPAAFNQAVKDNIFEGVPVYDWDQSVHTTPPGAGGPPKGSPNDIAGWVDNVTSTDLGLEADFHLSTSRPFVSVLSDAHAAGKSDLMGVSMRVIYEGRTVRHSDGKLARHVDKYTRGLSVDVVVNPSAGGRFLSPVAAESEGELDMSLLAEKIKRLGELNAPLAEGIDENNIEEAEVDKLILKATKPVADPALATPAPAPATPEPAAGSLAEGENPLQAQLDALLKREAKTQASAALNGSRLPSATRVFMQEGFDARVDAGEVLTEAVLQTEITAMREHLAAMVPPDFGAARPGLGSLITEADMISEGDKLFDGLLGFFMTENPALRGECKDWNGNVVAEAFEPSAPAFTSFRKAYVEISGDEELTGNLLQPNGLPKKEVRFAGEAAMARSDWTSAISAVINQILIRQISMQDEQEWRIFSEIVPLNNLQAQVRVEFGGFGDLPTVAEGAAYEEYEPPTDNEATYTPSKYGKTWVITKEAIIDDRVGIIRRMPISAAMAAKRTLNKAVLNHMLDNGTHTIDSKALFHADHSNTAVASLGSATLETARAAIYAQAELDSESVIGAKARWLLVADALAETAYDLVTPAKDEPNATPSFMQTKGINVVVTTHQNDTDMWILTADKSEIPIMEVGFFNGQQMPKLVIQDQPTAGMAFTNDQNSWKIGEWYFGYTSLDYRGVYAGIPA
jgi:hypothetical protein